MDFLVGQDEPSTSQNTIHFEDDHKEAENDIDDADSNVTINTSTLIIVNFNVGFIRGPTHVQPTFHFPPGIRQHTRCNSLNCSQGLFWALNTRSTDLFNSSFRSLPGDFPFKTLPVSLKDFSQLRIVVGVGASPPYWRLKLRCTVITDSLCKPK